MASEAAPFCRGESFRSVKKPAQALRGMIEAQPQGRASGILESQLAPSWIFTTHLCPALQVTRQPRHSLDLLGPHLAPGNVCCYPHLIRSDCQSCPRTGF